MIGAIAGGAPVAASNSHRNGNGQPSADQSTDRGRSDKKAATVEPVAVAAAATASSEPATSAQAAALSSSSKLSASPTSKGASKPAETGKSDNPGKSSKGAASAAAEPATTPSPAAAVQPADIQAYEAPVVMPAITPAAQSAPAPPQNGRRAASSTSSRSSTKRATPSGRSLPASPAARRELLPTQASLASTPARAFTTPVRSATVAPERVDTSAREKSASPLTGTVVRVLEVIPFWLRVTFFGLGGAGLLLGAAFAAQSVGRRRLERQRRSLLADVGVLQSALLPELPGRIGGAKVSAAYLPADGLAAGGDFYDAFELAGGRTAVIVGDVAGHGRDIVPLTASVRYSLRAYLEAGLTPRSTLNVAAGVLTPQLRGLQVTAVVAIFDPGTGRLTYACAGHPPPLLLGTTALPVTACSSPPIGAGVPTGRRQTTIGFAPGAAACFYTDGLPETPARFGRLGQEGVGEELHVVGPEGTAGELLARVVKRGEHQPDDMAACMLTALPGGSDHWSLQLEELEIDAAMLSRGWPERFLVACGVDRALTIKVLREARWICSRDGTAIIEVRVGEELAEVHVRPPGAVTLPIARRIALARETAAAS